MSLCSIENPMDLGSGRMRDKTELEIRAIALITTYIEVTTQKCSLRQSDTGTEIRGTILQACFNPPE